MSRRLDPNRPIREEIQDRVDLCRKLLAKGKRDGEIKKAVSAKYECSPRSVEKYLRRAREQIAQDMGRSRAILRDEACEYYLDICGDMDVDPRTRILARKRLDEILGLNAPFKLAQTDSEGNDIPIEQRREETARLLGILQRRGAVVSSGDSGNGNGNGRK